MCAGTTALSFLSKTLRAGGIGRPYECQMREETGSPHPHPHTDRIDKPNFQAADHRLGPARGGPGPARRLAEVSRRDWAAAPLPALGFSLLFYLPGPNLPD